MGQLLKALKDGNPGSGPKVDIFVDFENVVPTESEKAIYEEVLGILKIAPQLMEDMKGYGGGASVEIREAIQNPSDNVRQDRAWEVILLSVKTLKTFYLFSEDLTQIVVPRLLSGLCNTSMNPQEHLETQQALAKLLAETIQFVLLFDDLKTTTPCIQNDFSYYRRSMNRRSMSQNASNFEDGGISQEQANAMAMFFANSMPMLSCLTRGTASFLFGHPEIPMENTTDCLSTFATVCRIMIANPEFSSRFKNQDTVLFCLRVMTGTIILYDHVHPDGAFVKTSKIDLMESIRVLKEHPSSSQSLINALKFNTKHLHDDTTPKSVKSKLC
ncbi:Protein FAM49B-like [Oopsacas minuta]|uniref:Protein FAM49B-like n=1 Tax=Oopsacas minuta TaxID=111878 RepID=A0AAV7KG90_9METZ|nr:Protein FAM49B-like [Oopsacas minuta]